MTQRTPILGGMALVLIVMRLVTISDFPIWLVVVPAVGTVDWVVCAVRWTPSKT